MKKTILVIYTDVKLDINNIGYTKRYAFNTTEDVKIGQMFTSPQYANTNMQIVVILDKALKYFNKVTGDLSDVYTSSYQYEIRDFIIQENSNAVYATRIEEV